MAIQLWTVFAMVGPASETAAVRFERWKRTRWVDADTRADGREYPASTRHAVTRFLAKIANQRSHPPVAYWSEHVDGWSSFAVSEDHFVNSARALEHDTGELWCFCLPDRGALARRNCRLAKSAQWADGRRLASRI